MYQNYNYYPQTQPTQYTPQYARPVQPQAYLKGRLVSSLEEARATSIDFDGSIFYFPDLANRRIYTKQINLDGTATLNMYELKEVPAVNEYSHNKKKDYHLINDSLVYDECYGKSCMNRKAYLEAKHNNKDKAIQLRELEKYMQELTSDMIEMIQDSSPEEKQYLEKKISSLATKVGQMK